MDSKKEESISERDEIDGSPCAGLTGRRKLFSAVCEVG